MSFRRAFIAFGVLGVAALTVSGIALADDDEGRAARVTSSGGSISVPLDGSGPAQRLPLTQLTVSGRCTFVPPPPGLPGGGTGFHMARAVIEAAEGKTLDAFSPQAGTTGGTSLVTAPFADTSIAASPRRFGATTLIATSNRSTATITVGASIDVAAGTCTFLWQALESRN